MGRNMFPKELASQENLEVCFKAACDKQLYSSYQMEKSIVDLTECEHIESWL